MSEEISDNDHTKESTSDGLPSTSGTDTDDYPPWHITLVAALQHVMTNVGSMVAAAYIIYGMLCAGDNHVLFAELVSTSLFMSGICTALQVTIGVRLPVIQGSSYAFFPVISAMVNNPKWQCLHTNQNATLDEYHNGSSTPVQDAAWVPRILEISGSLVAASCIQVVLGCTGMVGFLLNFIGPITTIPVITLIGLSLVGVAIPGMKASWAISVPCMILTLFFCLVVRDVMVPFPAYSKGKGFHFVRYPFFRLFPNMCAIAIMWLLSYVLTVTDVFTSDPESPQFQARTDAKSDAIDMSSWWFLPYPGRWGAPTINAGTFIGMIAAVLASVMESVGDYHATATVCDLPPPPKHALNRGIAIEGVGSILSALVGACHPTTTYSNVPAQIKITEVRSRIVWVVYSAFMVGLGLCGKVGAALSTVPEPILGATLLVSLGMVITIGISPIKHIEISSRNMLIVGMGIVCGLMIPQVVQEDREMINTGHEELDNMLYVVLSTGLFLGGIIALILDNVVPGTREERGMNQTPVHDDGNVLNNKTINSLKVYDLPYWDKITEKLSVPSFIPLLPTYRERQIRCPMSMKVPATSRKNTSACTEQQTCL